MLIPSLFLTALFSMISLSRWRYGIIAVLVVGVLQDPFRKLTSGVPAYYILWSAVIFGLAAFSLWSRGRLIPMRLLALGDKGLQTLGRGLLLLIALHAVHSLLRWGSPPLVALGLLFYFAPVIALLVGWTYARSLDDLRRFMRYYVVIVGTVSLTVFLSPGYQEAFPVLREIGAFEGKRLIIYDVGTALESYSGLFRVGELAAWHAATTAIFLLILATDRSSIGFKILAGIVIAFCVWAIVLTGRRKMLMALTMFMILQWGGLALLRRGFSRMIVTGVLLGALGSFSFTFFERDTESSLYLERGVTVFENVDERVSTSFDLMRSAIARSGGLGLGVGVSSQGGRYAGVSSNLVGGSAEAGIGKFVVELGILGLLLFVGLAWRLARRAWQLFGRLARRDDRLLLYGVSFGAFLAANVATFLVATQLFGDPFVLIVIGLCAGMLFSILHTARAG